MTESTLEVPATATATGDAPDSSKFVDQLRTTTAAVRLRLSKFGTRRTLPAAIVSQTAQQFHAESQWLRGSKKLVDTKHPAYREVTAILGAAKIYWKMVSVPYPERGIRLIRKKSLDQFVAQMADYQAQLDERSAALVEAYHAIRQDAKQRLGDLFDEAEYPANIAAEFAIEYDFPTIAVPEYVKQLSPQLYEQQKAILNAKFAEAVLQNERDLASELSKMTTHLAQTLKDGKQIRESAVGNITEFFARFQNMSTGASAELTNAVEQVTQIVNGANVDTLRKDEGARATMASAFDAVNTLLESLVVDQATRQFDFDDE